MPVLYGGNSLRPVHGVSITKETQTIGDGRTIGSNIRATVTGTIVAEKLAGIYTPVPTDSRLSVILAEQKRIRDIFSRDGQIFEIMGWDGAVSTRFNARVASIEFTEGQWFDTSEYSVVLESEEISGEGGTEDHVQDAEESWSFEDGEISTTMRVTHRVSAKGKTVYDATGNIPTKAWEYARTFVKEKLKLGFVGTENTWSPKSGKNLAEESETLPPSTEEWNHQINESIDEIGGSYSVEETWILSEENYTEEYTLQYRRVDESPNVTVSIGIDGTIRGLRKNLRDVTTAFNNAKTRWLVVKNLLNARAATVGGGSSLSVHPVSVSVDYRQEQGEIAYQYQFDNRVLVNDTYETYSVSKQTSHEDYKTTVRIEGTIQGVINYDEDSVDPQLKLTRAKARWDTVQGLTLARAASVSGVGNLKAFPVSASVQYDLDRGNIQYTYEYDNRDPVDVRDEFTVSSKYSKEDGRTTITIEGTITGLRTAGSNDPFNSSDRKERYQRALSYFGGIGLNLLGKAALYVDTTNMNPKPYNQSVAHNEFNGTIQYSVEFNTLKDPCTPGAISEDISISDDDSVPVIATLTILGRPSGPLFQEMGTVTEKRRQVSINLVMPQPANPCIITSPPSVSVLQFTPQGSKVYKIQDQLQWSPNTGRYNRTVAWVYTP